MVKLGVLGTGRMGGGFVRALCQSDYDGEVLIYDAVPEVSGALKEQFQQVRVAESPVSLVEQSDVVLLGLIPDIFHKILMEIKEPAERGQKILISCVGFIDIPTLKTFVSTPWMKAYPNVNLVGGDSTTEIEFSKDVPQGQRDEIKDIFDKVGDAFVVEDGSFIPYGILTSSCPAYLAYVVDSFADRCAEIYSLDKGMARKMMHSTFLGTAEHMWKKGLSAEELTNLVTHPGGPTEAGTNAMKKDMDKAVEKVFRAIEKKEKDRLKNFLKDLE